jgi:hypothetical protein
MSPDWRICSPYETMPAAISSPGSIYSHSLMSADFECPNALVDRGEEKLAAERDAQRLHRMEG